MHPEDNDGGGGGDDEEAARKTCIWATLKSERENEQKFRRIPF